MSPTSTRSAIAFCHADASITVVDGMMFACMTRAKAALRNLRFYIRKSF